MVHVVDRRFELLFALILLLDDSLLLLQSLELLLLSVDVICNITALLVLAKIILHSFQDVSLCLLTTTESTSHIVLIALPRHTIETVRHSDNTLGCGLVITDKRPSEDHVHDHWYFGVKLNQVDSKLRFAATLLLDRINDVPGQRPALKLVKRHVSDALLHHLAFDKILGDVLRSHDHLLQLKEAC